MASLIKNPDAVKQSGLFMASQTGIEPVSAAPETAALSIRPLGHESFPILEDAPTKINCPRTGCNTPQFGYLASANANN